GPGRPDHFTPDQIAQIARTVRRAPEVMIKVSGGGNSLGAVAAHFRYITREGALELETDDGERVSGGGGARDPVGDWDLDIDVALDAGYRSLKQRKGDVPHDPSPSHPGYSDRQWCDSTHADQLS